ncbi:MAG: 6,7-dimethyl-8-ribityllumazine synthase [Cumulibacter sp.]
MSGEGRPTSANLDASGLSLAIVATRWNADLVQTMLSRALDCARDCSVSTPKVVHVAGAIELPVIVQQLARTHDAVVALGAVIRGGTPHFEYVCDSVTAGLTRIALDEGTPIGNGVLTCNTMEEALARSGAPGSTEDKGYEAAHAAIDTAITLAGLRGEK